jgi:hypothetical protein
MNQPGFPEMYEQWLVAPLFRPWAEIALDEVKAAPAIASSTWLAERASWRASPENGW